MDEKETNKKCIILLNLGTKEDAGCMHCQKGDISVGKIQSAQTLPKQTVLLWNEALTALNYGVQEPNEGKTSTLVDIPFVLCQQCGRPFHLFFHAKKIMCRLRKPAEQSARLHRNANSIYKTNILELCSFDASECHCQLMIMIQALFIQLGGLMPEINLLDCFKSASYDIYIYFSCELERKKEKGSGEKGSNYKGWLG